jgi:cell division protein ZapB
MSLELLSKLETKIQAALETIELLKMELEEEKLKSANLSEQNQQLQQDLHSWNEKITGLVGLLNNEVN